MPALQRASFGYLLRHPWQLALALAGITIGVAVMVAVDLASSSAQLAYRLSMETLNGNATHQVVGGPGGIDECIYAELRVAHGVQNIAPVVQGQAESGDRTLELLGIDIFAERAMRGFTASASGADGLAARVSGLLTMPGAVLLTPRTAGELAVEIGDRFELRVNGRTRNAILIDHIGSGAGTAALDDVVVLDIALAQEWLGMAGRLSRIDVRADDDDAKQLSRLLPADLEVLNAGNRTQTTAEMSRAFTTNLKAMSLLAMLVGVFLIYNSVSFAVLQRRNLLGILRGLGVTRGQVFRLLLGEALALGIAGALFGIAAGIWLGEQLLVLVSQSINDLYFRVSVTGVDINALSLARGFGAGLAATVAAAAIPACEASSWRPRLAMSRSVIERRAHSLLPWLAAAGAGCALLSLLLVQVSGDSLAAGLTALFFLIFGLGLCLPPAVRWLTRGCAWFARRFAGNAASLAIAGVAASLSRTGVAIVALAVAVSATIGVSIMVDSFRTSVSSWLDQTLRSDFYVAIDGGGDMAPSLVADLAAVDGIAAWSSSRRAWLETPEGRTRLVALKMAPESFAGTTLLDADPDTVWPAFERGEAVVVSEALAYRRAIRPGNTLTLQTGPGPRGFDVAATFRSYDANPETVLVSRRLYDRFWDDPAVDSLGIYLEPDADAQRVQARLRAATGDRAVLSVRSNRDLRQRSLEIFDRTFIITHVLYWLAVGVAVIGILGAMLALQMERARELAVLRALGVTRLELGGLVTLQTTYIGLLSGLAAIPLGLLMSWMLIDVINRRAFGWSMEIVVDPAVLWQALLLSAGVAFLAGIYPAWRASRAHPAQAMRED
ncbi:MAG: FtsX-like permease family protein [Woeseia sp.]